MMATYVVVDSSIAVKWFKPEGEAALAEALELLAQHARETDVLAAPAHMRLEVLNVLWANGFSERQLQTAGEDLEGFRIAWFPLDASLASEAVSIAVRHRLTVYDAAFAALARRLDAELVTADGMLARSRACRARLL